MSEKDTTTDWVNSLAYMAQEVERLKRCGSFDDIEVYIRDGAFRVSLRYDPRQNVETPMTWTEDEDDE